MKIAIKRHMPFLCMCIILFGSFTNNKGVNTQFYNMSSTILKYIPVTPGFVPDKVNQDKAKNYLNTIFKQSAIKVVTTEHVEFIDQGANFEDVSCNLCGKKIDMDWWQEAMDKAGKRNFNDLEITMPCCKKQSSLNNLKYNMPAGFAKFVILIPNAQKELTANELVELEQILNTKIRKVWAHY